MRIVKWILLLLGIVIIIFVGFAVVTAWTPPKSPPPLEVISAPFRTMNFTKLPPLSRYTARDSAKLAYRSYIAHQSKQTVVLIHGSSGASRSMHALAGYLQGQSITVYVPDMRGHGDSGRKGDIAYVGQLEDDLEDFVNQVLKDKQGATLIGFSAGGGFALRFAGSSRQKLFARYLLLAPFLRYDAPTTRPNNDNWAKANVPRIIGISLLGSLGEKWLGHLPVIAFAVDPGSAEYQTASYSYRLQSNFGPHYNYKADMKAAKQPMTVMAGKNDELFYPQKYLPVFASSQPHAEIIIVPGVGHITLTSERAGISAIAKTLTQ